MNLEGTLLYVWRKQQPQQTYSQPKQDIKTTEIAKEDEDVYQLAVWQT